MKTKTWKYGTKLSGEVMVVVKGSHPRKPRMAGVFVPSKDEAFIMVGVEHEAEPVHGQTVTIEFKQGGPTGGYWQIVKKTLVPMP